MKCPFCSSKNLRVTNSRPTEDSNSIRRRRLCLDCNNRFTTYERFEINQIWVLKSDNRREPYDRDKIEQGILRSLQKSNVNSDQVSEMVDKIEVEIKSEQSGEVSSKKIGEYILEGLLDLDEVAYIRFASVYRSFKDLDSFVNELEYLKRLKKKKKTNK